MAPNPQKLTFQTTVRDMIMSNLELDKDFDVNVTAP